MAVREEDVEEEGFVAVDVLAPESVALDVDIIDVEVDCVVAGLIERVVGSEGSKARRCVVEEEECVEEVEDWEDEIWVGEAAEWLLIGAWLWDWRRTFSSLTEACEACCCC